MFGVVDCVLIDRVDCGPPRSLRLSRVGLRIAEPVEEGIKTFVYIKTLVDGKRQYERVGGESSGEEK